MAEYISFQPSDYFNTKIYTGTGSSNAITGVGFQPDLIWIKNRDAADWQIWTDSVRGTDYNIYSNDLNAQDNYTTRVQSFDADGYTLGTQAEVNTNTEDFASWNWNAGTTSGIATNGSTTITPSAYSFNQTAGFSIIQYTGNGVAGAKVAHGLGAIPNLIIVKKTSSTGDWCMYHHAIDTGASVGASEDYNIKLNTNAARSNNNSFWNDTVPDSVNFTIGDSGDLNSDTTTNIAYCFAEKKGFSKFGSYIGNNGGANGVFVYTGFKPSLVIQKNSSNANGEWLVRDNKRNTYNPTDATLNADTVFVEFDGFAMDMLSNGFKTRADGSDQQNNGETYIYMAFAASPLVSSNSVPDVAR